MGRRAYSDALAGCPPEPWPRGKLQGLEVSRQQPEIRLRLGRSLAHEDRVLGREQVTCVGLDPAVGLDPVERDLLRGLAPDPMKLVSGALVDVRVPVTLPAASVLMFSVPLNPLALMCHCPCGAAMVSSSCEM